MPTSRTAGLRTLLSKPWARRLLEVALFLLVLVAVNAYQTRGLPSAELPPFALPTLDGRTFESATLRGRPTLLMVFAPWCAVCAVESQNISWVRRMVGARAEVIALAVHYDDVAEVQAFAREHEVDYPVLLGGRHGARPLGVSSFPTLLFLDEQGRVERAAVGYTTTLGMLLRLLF